MSATAVLLVLLSAGIHVFWNALLKGSGNPRHFSLLKGATTSVVAAGVLPFLPLADVPIGVWPYIIASGVIHTVYALSLSAAYTHGEISFVYPIARSAPAFVPLAAFFLLGEIPSAQGIVGISIVVVGIVALQVRRGEIAGWLGFIRSKESAWAFLTLASVVGYTLVDKAGMVRLSVSEIPDGLRGPMFFILENFICYALFWSWALMKGERGFCQTFRRENWRIPVAALATITSYSLILHVMQTEPVSYIVTLRQSSVVMAVLVGTLILREKRGATRLAIAGAMLLGFWLVAKA